MRIVSLPAVGLTRGGLVAFVWGFRKSYEVMGRAFSERPPQGVLAMGGFTSAPALLAAKRRKALTFLHESNTIPGRANRWLSWRVAHAFVGFPSAAKRLHARRVTVTGTPVRTIFERLDINSCRRALGLDPDRPVALVMGGSQGASGINRLVMGALPFLAKIGPEWQWLHLAGAADVDALKQAYAVQGLKATVHPFFERMDLAMGAATAGISRAGASSLAELAAVRLPAVLIPFPAATDNHQFHNATAYARTGAARLLEQGTARPEDLTGAFQELMCEQPVRQEMQNCLAAWHRPDAAEAIARAIVEAAGKRSDSLQSGLPGIDPETPTDPRMRPSNDSGQRKSCVVTFSPCLETQRSGARTALKGPGQRASRAVVQRDGMPVGVGLTVLDTFDQPVLSERTEA